MTIDNDGDEKIEQEGVCTSSNDKKRKRVVEINDDKEDDKKCGDGGNGKTSVAAAAQQQEVLVADDDGTNHQAKIAPTTTSEAPPVPDAPSPAENPIIAADRLSSTTETASTIAAPTPASSSSNATNINTNINTNTNNATVFIGNIPTQYCTETVIEKIMSKYGTIVRCVVKSTPKNQYAFCEFASPRQATDAITNVHNRTLAGRRLTVRYAHQSSTSKNQYSQQQQQTTTTTATPISDQQTPREQQKTKQRIDSRIEAIKRKLSASASKKKGG